MESRESGTTSSIVLNSTPSEIEARDRIDKRVSDVQMLIQEGNEAKVGSNLQELLIENKAILEQQKKQLIFSEQLKDEITMLQEQLKMVKTIFLPQIQNGLEKKVTQRNSVAVVNQIDQKLPTTGLPLNVNVKMQNIDHRLAKLDEFPKLELTVDKLK